MSTTILGPPISDWNTVRANLLRMMAAPLGVETVAPMLWAVAIDHGVNPEGVIAQSFKETGGWHYQGRVRDWFYNTAGIKVRHDRLVRDILGTDDTDHPLVHQMFPNWHVGVLAHIQRLLDYCGIQPTGLLVDPRNGFGLRGITHWHELGGRWTSDPDYGNDILEIRGRLVRDGSS